MKREFGETAGSPGEESDVPPVAAARPVLTLDVSLYERYLADSGMTDAQKQELLEALWSIIVGFVDLGFGIDPVSNAVGGDDSPSDGENSPTSDFALLSSDDQTKEPTERTPSLRADIESAVRKGRRT